jgi:hypothetical protein
VRALAIINNLALKTAAAQAFAEHLSTLRLLTPTQHFISCGLF